MVRAAHPIVVVLALIAPGCVLTPLDLEGKSCPCAAGWVCDEARDRCVQRLGDGGLAGPDALVEDPTTACDDLLRDAIFCESFEDRSLLHWTVREAYDGTVEHSAGAFRGAGALAGRSTAPGGYGERLAAVVGGITDGDLHVRAYVYFPDGAPLVHSSIVHVGGHRSRIATEPIAGFNVVDGYAAMYIGAGNVSLRDMRVAIPRDRWICMQMMLHVDDVAGEARVWIDGELAGEVTGIDTRPDGAYESLGAGVAWSPLDQEPFEARIDELAVGRTMLPCE